MVRDYIKDKAYFDKYIASLENRIDKFKTAADELPKDKHAQKLSLYNTQTNLMKNLVAAKYSSGASKNEIRELVKKYFALLKLVKVNSYNDYVDALSLSILTGEKLNNVVEDDKYIDALTLILGHKCDEKKTDLLYRDFYQPFYNYAIGKSSMKELTDYMENEWYDKCEVFSWFDSHNSKHQIYAGYWCWLAAAVIKLSKVKDCPKIKYVPADLL